MNIGYTFAIRMHARFRRASSHYLIIIAVEVPTDVGTSDYIHNRVTIMILSYKTSASGSSFAIAVVWQTVHVAIQT